MTRPAPGQEMHECMRTSRPGPGSVVDTGARTTHSNPFMPSTNLRSRKPNESCHACSAIVNVSTYVPIIGLAEDFPVRGHRLDLHPARGSCSSARPWLCAGVSSHLSLFPRRPVKLSEHHPLVLLHPFYHLDLAFRYQQCLSYDLGFGRVRRDLLVVESTIDDSVAEPSFVSATSRPKLTYHV